MHKKIKYLIIDVDGTLTNGQIYIGINGEIMKAFNVRDGFGIHDILPPHGIIPVVFTGRTSPIVEKRCSELGITEIYQSVKNKKKALLEFVENHETSLSEVAYMGDDVNDLECMVEVKKCNGLAACPGDAESELKNVADYISTYNGGYGAVRDFINWLVK
ncbi:HAD family hydrolase [uncultured Fibrobacter sp.]|jgi:3-deoxy-D-manno-octulosonate 8-phosphate phosphatase (KDO 8-P phosphatase)|uniref:KdsC family phosphatase n=1 Tax=uncultured Fibrobacter sp. TaxID=261512 RepID=UPI0025EE0132|nr:HAD-IIIA family hydrolase [uncultured Fibrobacter sp.]